jgi:bla regulator protein blaR1
MNPLFNALADHLWQSTLFAVAVGLLTLVLRRNRAAVRHALWLAASVKFLVPFSVLIGLGSQIEWRKAPAFVQPQVSFVMEEISRPFAPAAPLLASAPSAPGLFRWPVPALLFSVWLCGFAANCLAWWRRWRRVRAALDSASPLPVDSLIPGFPIRVMSSPARLEPGIFGIRKPVLLLPDGIASRLTPGQFQAVLAHELCHVQRRDNLAAATHMVVEALFWFHPLVWWIQARLVEERERACDEEVLRMAADPQDYAEGILNVCKFCLESPLVCVSGVTGANLKRRVEAIMINRGAYGLNFARKLLLAAAGMSVVAGPLVVGTLVRAQVTVPKFEVASVKPHVQGSGFMPLSCSNGRLISRGYPLVLVLQWAYDLNTDQYRAVEEKLPGWMFPGGGPSSTLAYDIEAKAERPVPESQCRLMMQALLADRFKFAAHWESKEAQVSDLVVARGGPKLQKAEEAEKRPEVSITLNGRPLTGPRTAQPKGMTMQELAAFLTSGMRLQPIYDKTGLEGRYRIDLRFSIQPPGTDRQFEDPDLETALQRQLGLKLEKRKGSVSLMIVDRIERPDPN